MRLSVFPIQLLFSLLVMAKINALKQKLFGESNLEHNPAHHLSPNLSVEIPHNRLSLFHRPPSPNTSPQSRASFGSIISDEVAGNQSEIRDSPNHSSSHLTAEHRRLDQDRKKTHPWKRWGPYLSERQWATVREDYSADGDAWTHFPHDHARSRAYRWGEDGIGGFSDDQGRLCWSLALWNENDLILKERLFGVTGHEGNHGEDVKELYYYLDSTVSLPFIYSFQPIEILTLSQPTHSYMKFLYKYPQSKFPYETLVDESSARDRNVTEFELLDTGVFDDDKYWDVYIEVGAKLQIRMFLMSYSPI